MRYRQLWPFHKLDIGRLDSGEYWYVFDPHTGICEWVVSGDVVTSGRQMWATPVWVVPDPFWAWQAQWRADSERLMPLFNNYKEAMKKVVDENA